MADVVRPVTHENGKGSRKNNLAFCCCLSGLMILLKNDIGCCKPENQQPFGARRRTGICSVAAPRRCHHIACVAAPCIFPPGARAKMPTYLCANPKLAASPLMAFPVVVVVSVIVVVIGFYELQPLPTTITTTLTNTTSVEGVIWGIVP